MPLACGTAFLFQEYQSFVAVEIGTMSRIHYRVKREVTSL